MRIHTDGAWKIAANWGEVLASDTRTLAAMIDDRVDKKIEQAARAAYIECARTHHVKLGEKVEAAILALKRSQAEPRSLGSIADKEI